MHPATYACSLLFAANSVAAPFDLFPDIHDVPAEYPTVSIALAASSDGDTIRLAPGAYHLNIIISGKGVRIQADGEVTIEANLDAPIFTIEGTWEDSMVTFDGINFDGSFAGDPQDVRAIKGTSAHIECVGCEFEDFAPGLGIDQSVRSGGAISVSGGSLSLFQCTFDDCEASGDGGALSASVASVAIDESAFWNCDSGDDGGAIKLYSCSTELSQTSLYSNDASDNGGHVFMMAGNLMVNRCAFMWGDAMEGGAAWSGGSDFFGDAEVTVTNSLFGGNEVSEGMADVWHHEDSIGPYTGSWKLCATSSCTGVSYPVFANSYVDNCLDCAADPNEDGVTDVLDLLEVLMHWGERDPFTDLNWDDTTDAGDLVELLDAWGGCEPFAFEVV
ncbi:MAG: hypothetical protein MK074_08850 [Phycisphaerales bacterium]|nr:hypothetical protein [Phycisphaerales bacterium]